MNIAELYGHVKTKLKNLPSDRWPLPECVMGIEIEVENIFPHLIRSGFINDRGGEHRVREYAIAGNHPMSSYWVCHIDNSLRDEGIEFVSKPLFGEDLTDGILMLHDFCLSLAASDCNYKFSSRCGTHIHLDVRDLNKEELLSLICLYSLYEHSLFNFWDINRAGNVYCVPINNQNTFSTVFAKLMVATNQQTVLNLFSKFHQEYRYSALNLASISKYGSLEFRHGYGTFDTEKLTAWICMIMQLKKYILGKTIKEVVTDITKSDFEMLSHRVFDNYFYALFPLDFANYKPSMMEGKHVLKSILLGSLEKQTAKLMSRTRDYVAAWYREPSSSMSHPVFSAFLKRHSTQVDKIKNQELDEANPIQEDEDVVPYREQREEERNVYRDADHEALVREEGLLNAQRNGANAQEEGAVRIYEELRRARERLTNAAPRDPVNFTVAINPATATAGTAPAVNPTRRGRR